MRKNKILKSLKSTKQAVYSINFSTVSLGDTTLYPEDWCTYKGVCPLIEKDINEDARYAAQALKSKGTIMNWRINRHLQPDICMRVCKYFRKINIPKILRKK